MLRSRFIRNGQYGKIGEVDQPSVPGQLGIRRVEEENRYPYLAFTHIYAYLIVTPTDYVRASHHQVWCNEEPRAER
jgi:hypothetical protein